MAARPPQRREALPLRSSSSKEPPGDRVLCAAPLEKPREAGSHVPARKPGWRWQEAMDAANRRRKRRASGGAVGDPSGWGNRAGGVGGEAGAATSAGWRMRLRREEAGAATSAGAGGVHRRDGECRWWWRRWSSDVGGDLLGLLSSGEHRSVARAAVATAAVVTAVQD